LILHYLSTKPYLNIKNLEEEFQKNNALPTRVTWDGKRIPLSYDELVRF
jgi:hypothetical protein